MTPGRAFRLKPEARDLDKPTDLDRIHHRIIACTRCERLRTYCQQ